MYFLAWPWASHEEKFFKKVYFIISPSTFTDKDFSYNLSGSLLPLNVLYKKNGYLNIWVTISLTKLTEENLSQINEPSLKSSAARGNCEYNPEGLRPCKRGTWAGGGQSVIHWDKETGIWKRTSQGDEGGGGAFASCRCDFPSWHLEGRRRRCTEQSSLPRLLPPVALCSVWITAAKHSVA